MASTGSQLFFCRHTFVQEARLSTTGITFEFSPDTQSPGPFAAKLEIAYEQRTQVFESQVIARGKWPVAFRHPVYAYAIRLWLDDHLAYANAYDSLEEEIPF